MLREKQLQEMQARLRCRRAGWLLLGGILLFGLLILSAWIHRWALWWPHQSVMEPVLSFAIAGCGGLACSKGLQGVFGLRGTKGFRGEQALGCGAGALGCLLFLVGLFLSVVTLMHLS